MCRCYIRVPKKKCVISCQEGKEVNTEIYTRNAYPLWAGKTNGILSYGVHNFGWNSRSQWPRGLRRRSTATRLLRSWVRIPRGAWMFVCCECCVLSGGGLCDELITRPEESYRLCCVVVCDLETSRIGAPYIYNVRLLRVNSMYLILQLT